MKRTQPSFSRICFDCDSTLSRIEGIDELARDCGVGAQVKRLTNRAMDGEIPLESVYGQRLALIRPGRAAIDALAQRYIDERVDGVLELFSELRRQGKPVHIISGGIRQAILPLADYLGLPEQYVHAVDVYFDSQGVYQGFDQQSPLARSGGKAQVCRFINSGGEAIVMVGDGQTDLEAKQAGAFFIGFGGVVVRETVKQQADMYITEPSLWALAPFLVNETC